MPCPVYSLSPSCTEDRQDPQGTPTPSSYREYIVQEERFVIQGFCEELTRRFGTPGKLSCSRSPLPTSLNLLICPYLDVCFRPCELDPVIFVPALICESQDGRGTRLVMF